MAEWILGLPTLVVTGLGAWLAYGYERNMRVRLAEERLEAYSALLTGHQYVFLKGCKEVDLEKKPWKKVVASGFKKERWGSG